MRRDQPSAEGGIASFGARPPPIPIPNHGYTCTICFKVFQTGQALGGHQSSHHHLLARQLRPNILGAVLNHPLPPDNVHSLAAALARGASNNRNHPLPPRRRNDGSNYLITRARTAGSSHYYHHCLHERKPSRAEKANKRRRATKNLLRQLKLIPGLDHDIGSSPGGSKSNPIIIDDGVDLELSLNSSKEYVNLELKLGY